jgi:rubrerythrin
MTDEPTLADIDVDGAVRETAAAALDALDAEGDTRSGFLRRAGLAGGAFAGGGAALMAMTPSAEAYRIGNRPPKRFGKGDYGILNFALMLEYLESTFYNEATANQARTTFIPNSEPFAQTFLKTVTSDEAQHVVILRTALGDKQLKKPKFDYHGDNADYAKFLKASFGFENEGVHAYSGQAFNIKTPAYLAVALSIVTIEARHAAVVGLLKDNSQHGIAPSGAFDTPAGATSVLNVVRDTHYIQ